MLHDYYVARIFHIVEKSAAVDGNVYSVQPSVILLLFFIAPVLTDTVPLCCLISLYSLFGVFYCFRMMVRSTVDQVRLNCWTHFSNAAAVHTGWDFQISFSSNFPPSLKWRDWNCVHATLAVHDSKLNRCFPLWSWPCLLNWTLNFTLACQHYRSSHTGHMKCAMESI